MTIGLSHDIDPMLEELDFFAALLLRERTRALGLQWLGQAVVKNAENLTI